MNDEMIPTTNSPPTLLGEENLHGYQRFCVDFLEQHPQCALFLDCGLGKTIITLTAIQHLMYDSFEVHRVLIIAPLRVARDTWIAELTKWRQIKTLRMEDQKFYEFLLAAFHNWLPHLAEGASAYIFHADTEGLNFRRAFKESGFHISGVCIWVKNSLVLGRSPYQWQHEPVLFGWLPNGKHKWFSDRKQTTVWNYDKPKHSKEHPTMKPIPLLAYPIKNSSAPNGIVLDTFGGSGSTLVACEQTDRICYTLELDEKYASVIVQRYVDLVESGANVSVLRDGEKLAYEDVVQLKE